MLFLGSLLWLQLLNSCFALDITEDTVLEGDLLGQSIRVSNHVSLSTLKTTKNLIGGVDVGTEAAFHVASVDNGDQFLVDSAGEQNELSNNGLITFRSSVAITEMSIKYSSIKNYGELYVSSDDAASLGLSGQELYNQGLLSFSSSTSRGTIDTEYSEPIVNNGDVCFRNYNFRNHGSVQGSGCWHVLDNSELDMRYFGWDNGHTVTVQFAPGATGVLHTQPRYSDEDIWDKYIVRGFGEGMGISISAFGLSLRIEYSGSELRFYSEGYYQIIDIGSGYDKSLFFIEEKTDDEWGSTYPVLAYRGPVPAEAAKASNCGQCTRMPELPQLPQSSTLAEAVPTTSLGFAEENPSLVESTSYSSFFSLPTCAITTSVVVTAPAVTVTFYT